jgi:hypothetical protein
MQLDRFTGRWAEAVGAAGGAPLGPTDLRRYLGELGRCLLSALAAEPFSDEPGERVGLALVAARLDTPSALGATVRALPGLLLDAARDRFVPTERAVALACAVFRAIESVDRVGLTNANGSGTTAQ